MVIATTRDPESGRGMDSQEPTWDVEKAAAPGLPLSISVQVNGIRSGTCGTLRWKKWRTKQRLTANLSSPDIFGASLGEAEGKTRHADGKRLDDGRRHPSDIQQQQHATTTQRSKDADQRPSASRNLNRTREEMACQQHLATLSATDSARLIRAMRGSSPTLRHKAARCWYRVNPPVLEPHVCRRCYVTQRVKSNKSFP